MAKGRSGSFATRLLLAYVGAAVGLLFLIGFASTVFTLQLYRSSTNEIIGNVETSLRRRIADPALQRLPLPALAQQLTIDYARPRIRIAVYDEERHLLSESAPLRRPIGVVGALALLLTLRRAEVLLPHNGQASVSADLNQLNTVWRNYWLLMLPVGALAVALAWIAGFVITQRAVRPINQISAALRRMGRGAELQPIRANRDDEIGELAHSYNRALHQVRSAFAERDRTETQIRQFIADAGHELRTPLTVIMGYLDVLEDGAADAPGVRERVFATLRQESRRMRALIEKLIYLARLERGDARDRQLVDVSMVVTRVADSLGAANSGTRIEITVAPEALVLADEVDVFEAIRNLVDNALKYAPGSPVQITTAVGDDDVTVAVRDRGPGMSEFDRTHAFDRFYRGRVHDDVEGTGLGLAIVKSAVQRAEGTVELDSRVGEGSAFTLRFPRADRTTSDGHTLRAPGVLAAKL